MAEPDIIRLLLSSRWEDVPACLARHETETMLLDDGAIDRLVPGSTPGPRAGYPSPDDVGVMLRLSRIGGSALAVHHVTFVQASAAVPLALTADDREDLLTEALTSGLIVTDALDRPVLLDRLVALTEAALTLDRPSTQLMALVATARSTAFTLTGDVVHADASIDAFRTVIAPPDGLGPLHDSGLTGARAALALLLAARDRAITGPGSEHDDLLEAIAIARAAAHLDPPLQPDGELATNTLLTLLAELYQVTGDVAVVDDALGIIGRLADKPPTVAQLAARVLWLRLRYERSTDPDDLTRALLTVDEALTRAVTDAPTAYDPADVDGLREARRHILLALSDLRKRPPDDPS